MAPWTTRLAGTRHAAECLAALAALAGCGGSSPVPETTPPPASDGCVLPTGDPGEPRELTVAAVRPEDSTVAVPQVTEPLIRLDCSGAARPGAAESWVPDSTHRTWTFTLGPSALGVTAASAASGWSTRPDAATTLRYSGVASVVPLDERRLAVSFDRPSDSVPALFADPSLGLPADSLSPAGVTFLLRPAAGGDPRDALDAGADILRTADPALLDYARTRSDLTVHPLPWSRTYVLVVPADRPGFAELTSGDSAVFRAGLARDAVRAEARGAEPPFWWTGIGPCPALDDPGPLDRPPASSIVGYPRDDLVARGLAERIVALSDDPALTVGALPPRRMAETLRAGALRAYVVGMPRHALVPCRELGALPQDAILIPLIDTRMSVIARRGIPRLTVDYDGSLRPAETP